jgi:hypothetical protein
MSLPESELLERFDRMRVWQRGGQRAVHEQFLPLLAGEGRMGADLLALGRLWRDEPPSAQAWIMFAKGAIG